MNDSFFRVLDTEETEQFKQWARENFVPGMEVSEVWHPVIRAELARLQAEVNQPVETPLGEEIDNGYDYDDYNAQYDDDPSPYDGTYSED